MPKSAAQNAAIAKCGVVEMFGPRYCRRSHAGRRDQRIELLVHGPMGHHRGCENRRYRHGSCRRCRSPSDGDCCSCKHDERDKRDWIVAACQDKDGGGEEINRQCKIREPVHCAGGAGGAIQQICDQERGRKREARYHVKYMRAECRTNEK